MLARAMVRHLRMSPRKVQYVIAPLRRRSVAEALALLGAAKRAAAQPVAKVLASAFANARQREPQLREDEVIISRFVADGGPSWKRFRAAAFGRAVRILKRTTHVTVELERKGHGA